VVQVRQPHLDGLLTSRAVQLLIGEPAIVELIQVWYSSRTRLYHEVPLKKGDRHHNARRVAHPWAAYTESLQWTISLRYTIKASPTSALEPAVYFSVSGRRSEAGLFSIPRWLMQDQA
jgi:hypothetical protein